MPDIDGLTLVKTFRARSATQRLRLSYFRPRKSQRSRPRLSRAAPMTATSSSCRTVSNFWHGSAITQKVISTCSERNEAYQAAVESQSRLANEMKQAAHYVRSILPDKLRKGKIITDWRFIPSAELGGDSFGYHWLDDDHFAFYLLDVSGHGVGSALLSVSAMNALRSQCCHIRIFVRLGQV